MLYGQYPWSATNENSLRMSIEKEKIKFPTENPISMGMKKFIMSCLM